MYRLLLCCLVLASMVGPAWGQLDSCLPNELGVNRLNNGTNLVLGGIPTQVVAKDLKRCQLVLQNQGVVNITCLAEWQGPPTTTKGVLIEPGKQLAQNTSGRGAWSCVTAGSPGSVLVLEELPNAP
jgi:hypothetical protein